MYKVNETHVPTHVVRAGIISYSGYTMLAAIANYSTNELCSERAKWLLNEDEEDYDMKQGVVLNSGSFMSHVCDGNFAKAYMLADESNRQALGKAIMRGEIEIKI